MLANDTILWNAPQPGPTPFIVTGINQNTDGTVMMRLCNVSTGPRDDIARSYTYVVFRTP